MAKTSMFGGHLASAGIPLSPTGTRLIYQSQKKNEDPTVDSNVSVKGSTVYASPSPKKERENSNNVPSDKFSVPGGMSFLERMAQ